MSIFQRKSLEVLLSESKEEGKNAFKKTLGAYKLIALGLGAIIGAGLFSITGLAAGNYAGPAITISFVIAAIGCAFAALCYAEFASMLPVSGSAYTYSYATLGEFIAWVIGWDLVLEYAVGALTVSISWSRYIVILLEGLQIHLPLEWTAGPWEGGICNLPAALIVVLMSLLLIRGTESSARVNSIIVFLKIAIVFIFIILGWQFIRTENYVPYIPNNTGTWGNFGFSGIIRAAAIVFFAFIGFDAVSTAAQETKNPQRNLPIGIMGSLIICVVLYILFAHVMTGVAHYTAFQGQNGIAPVAISINNMGTQLSNGTVQAAYPWLNKAIILAILAGYSSVILVLLMGQSRVFYSMSRDKLLPHLFSIIHPKFSTPFKSNIVLMITVGLLALFIPANVAGELTSIGTLLAFIIVSIGILVMRKMMPNAPRVFKTPCIPYVPLLGIAICLFMMVFLPFDTWIRLILWMLIGHNIYVFYGSKHSQLETLKTNKDHQLLSIIGIGLALLLSLLIIMQYNQIGWENNSITAVTLLSTALLHIVMYGTRFLRKN